MKREIAAVVLAVLLAMGGCLGFVTGEEPLTLEAEAAAVNDAAVDRAGYESNGTRPMTINQTVEIAGQSRDVEITNQISMYDKTVRIPILGEAKLGTVGLISTPAVEIAGRTLNPIGDVDNDRLVQMVGSRYGGLNDIERVSSHNLSVLGSETEVTKYAATATVRGQSVDVFVHVTRVRHEADFVVALGVYPQQLSDEEEGNVLDMMRAVEHPA